MIVRIMGEGQWLVPEEEVDELNRLDDQVTATVDAGDDAAFTAALTALLTKVRPAGTCLPDEELVPSDAVVPREGATPDEVRELLTTEGLIPG